MFKIFLSQELTNFNLISSSLAVVSQGGYKLFTISSINKVEEIYCSDDVDTKIAERLFSSSLVAVVTNLEPEKLKVNICVIFYLFLEGTRAHQTVLSVCYSRVS